MYDRLQLPWRVARIVIDDEGQLRGAVAQGVIAIVRKADARNREYGDVRTLF